MKLLESKNILWQGGNYSSQMIRPHVDYKINNNVANQTNFVIKAQLMNARDSMRQDEKYFREKLQLLNVLYLVPKSC